jgi:hypothetical protein
MPRNGGQSFIAAHDDIDRLALKFGLIPAAHSRKSDESVSLFKNVHGMSEFPGARRL